MLSMPRGTDPMAVQRAAREFARSELIGHKYVMVLHDHQANPHVHISVRAESRHGKRLNPRKTDLHRWRETFAGCLRELSIDAEASRQTSRVQSRTPVALWRLKAQSEGRLKNDAPTQARNVSGTSARTSARDGWLALRDTLARSGEPTDVKLAACVSSFLGVPTTAGVSRSPDRADISLHRVSRVR
jgi:hypothetical protein